jgi:putative copper export protein/streptogramin lyase
LEKPPAKVEVFLSEPVDDRYSEVKVLGPNGKQIDNKDTQHFDGDQSTLGVTLPSEGLEGGIYTVSTKMLSQIDGHVTDDAFVFGVGETTSLSSSAGSAQAGQGSTVASAFDELSAPDAIARYPALVGQVVIVGACFASLWLWKPFANVTSFVNSTSQGKDEQPGRRDQKRTVVQTISEELGQFRKSIDQRLVKIMLIGSVIVVAADFGMIYALAYSLNVGMIDAMTTKFGNIWFVRTAVSFFLFGLILFVYLKVKRRRRKRALLSANSYLTNQSNTNPLASGGLVLKRELVAIMIVGFLTLLTTSLMGHGAAMNTGAQIPITIDFVHNLAASIWIGGVIYLALDVVPKLRRSERLDERIKSSILCILIPRFSTLPVVVLGVIVITGPFLLYILEDDLNLTIASLYGKALFAKLIIAAIMLMMGGYNQRVIHRNALNALAATQRQQQQQQQHEQVIVSKIKEDEKSYSSTYSPSSSSTPTSSTFSSEEDANIVEKEGGTSQNKFAKLIKNVQQRITRNRNWGKYPSSRRYDDSKPKNNGNNPAIYDDHDHSRNAWSKTVSRFNRSIKIEAILGILLLGAVAVLTNTGLPASEFQGQLQQNGQNNQQTDIQNLLITASGFNNGIGQSNGGGAGGQDIAAGGYSATQYIENATGRIKLSIEPFTVGNNNFEIEFLDSLGKPIDMRTVGIKMTQTTENIGPIEIQSDKVSNGLFTANASFGLAGEWDMIVEGFRNQANTLDLVATFNLFVKPDIDQIDYSVTQVAMPDNKSQPLYPVFDPSRNSIWVGDTALGTGRIFEYDIANREYQEHKINGTNIITTMAFDQSNDRIWFIDPISKMLGVYDPQTNSTQLHGFPNDRIVPSSIAIRSADFLTSLPIINNESGGSVTSRQNSTVLGTVEGGQQEIGNQVGGGSETVWITSPSTGEVLIFDTKQGNFTDSVPLPTPNSNPLGIAIDSSTGQVWVAEGVGKIANIDPANNFSVNEFAPASSSSGGGGGGSGSGIENDTLISPTALLLDPYSGNIYISEHDGHVVSVFNPVFRTFSDFAPLAKDALPFGMALDKDRNLWVAEHVTNRIAVIDPSTGKFKEVTLPSASPFVQYLTTDSEGKVWFAAQRGNAIGYITSTVNPLKGQSSPASPLSSSNEGQSQQGNSSEIASTYPPGGLTPIAPLFNIGFENLVSPIIAAGVFASAAFYINSVLSLKSSIKQVNGTSTTVSKRVDPESSQSRKKKIE